MAAELQRTADWYAARVGKVTASRISDVVARTKNGWGVMRQNYLNDLVAERLTGIRQDAKFINEPMQWGIDHEREAREIYATTKNYAVEECGFIDHPRVAMSGASPDGLIAGGEGLIEIKCPLPSTHIDTLRTGSIPEKYRLQMHWQMACTGRHWCDYVSYDPRVPEGMRLFVKRQERDNELITQLEFMVIAFNHEVDELVADLHKRYGI